MVTTKVKGGIDKTLFVKSVKGKLMIAQIYVVDIVFGGMSDQMVEHFVKQMKSELEMSMVGELNYFLGLQVKQMEDSMFISQIGVCARYHVAPKESHILQVKRIIKYIGGTIDYGTFYAHNSDPKLIGYCDADWAGNADDRKSTSGGCFFLGNNLISGFSKKQNCVSLSTAEAEYIATGSGCTQLMWMK
ncbi:secreted RxLR effector protein 161-like [Lotus japonicus]|uniref:secreted RxLR effector protein 161-like n=1 Tax=Lotus japonicus TaxID=34305 RepID=UPI0025827C20|nr:secreted RxLR effector protein 161-like [Lotus japonicus]